MKNTSLFKLPVVWLVIVLLAVASSIFLFFNFEKANPLVNISIDMDRDEAITFASELGAEFNLGPKDYRIAASFSNDSHFQNYTELEGGGLDVFNTLIANGSYHSYQWKVRHFKEKEVNEVVFYFTPQGKAYGFTEKISEDLPGASLSADSALQLAFDASGQWEIDLQNYTLVEKSMNEKPGGRLDHEFVFEHNDIQINESKLRIAISVSGDKVTSIRHFVKIPEDFDRRFSEMRSANNLISAIGQAFLFIVYGLIGIGIGLFFLMKRRFLKWKKAMYWAIAIGLGTGLFYVLNALPLLWFNYDTSETAGSFIGRRLLNGFMETLLMGGFIFITALAGEGLGRYVFGNHIQFWKVWGKGAGASKEVLGQTVGAYLFVPVFLAIDVLYYLLTTHYLGWWNPAGTLSDPDILAQSLPWFGSIAISLQAGFWEEIMCRAIPLAGVYLLVRNLKSKNFWMILTLLAQTIIFGMLHASYPQSPSYARVFEMIVPFLIFGLIYLRFGLLPVIIAHYAIDVFWISLPIWVASSPEVWVSQIVILLLFFMPLWIVFYWRLKNRKWSSVPDSLRNKAWEPSPIKVITKIEVEPNVRAEVAKASRFFNLKWLIPGAIIGLVVWGIFTFPIESQSPTVNVNKEKAVKMANGFLTKEFKADPTEWKILTSIESSPSMAHKFVWREFESDYMPMQQSFLNSPYWMVRYVKPEAPVEERAEEYLVKITVDGSLLGFKHIWPEKREGENLNETEAIQLAEHFLSRFAGVDQWELNLVKSEPTKLDARTDWNIEFSDTTNYTLAQGQGRYKLSVAGNEVNSFSRYVFVPENWERNYDKNKSVLGIYTLISNLFLFAILIFGIVLGVVNWSRKRFSIQLFLIFGVIYMLVSLYGIFGSWDSIISKYFTGLPYGNFITMTLIGVFIGLVFLGLGIAIIGGFSCEISKNDSVSKHAIIKAFMVGAVLAGIQSLKMNWIPQLSPDWFPLGNLNEKVVVLGLGFDPIQRFVFNPAFLMILYFLTNTITKNFSKLKAFGLLVIFVAGFIVSGVGANSVSTWFIVGSCSGVIFVLLYLLLKNNLACLPMVLVVSLVLQQLEVLIFNPYQGALLGSVLAIVIWSAAAVLWYVGIKKCNI